ncbi:MAG: GHKL domain-containing protein [Crocinitomicaceae bacterium]|nr:GHKL domain-containing protein [Crocinitomicaceae bacterium]
MNINWKLYSPLLIGLLLLSTGVLMHLSAVKNDFNRKVYIFQQSIYEADFAMHRFMDYATEQIESKGLAQLWEDKHFNLSIFGFHVLQNQEVVFWNNNDFPIQEINNHSIAENAVERLSNGYYWIKQKQVKDYVLIFTMRIKQVFPFENEYLKSNFHHQLFPPNGMEINLSYDSSFGYPIYSKKNKWLFNLAPEKNTSSMTYEVSDEIFFMYFLSLAFALFWFLNWMLYSVASKWIKRLVFPLSIFVLRGLLFELEKKYFFTIFSIYDSGNLAISSMLPSLGSLLVSALFLSVLVIYFLRLSDLKTETADGNKYLYLLLYLLLMLSVFGLNWIFSAIVLNSAFPLKLEEFFSLTTYSILAVILMGVLFFLYYFSALRILKMLILYFNQYNRLAIIWFLSAVLFLILHLYFDQGYFFLALWPAIINGLLFVFLFRYQNGGFRWFHHLLLLSIFCLHNVLILNVINLQNEYQKRELFANILITDRDPVTEFEFLNILPVFDLKNSLDELIQSASMPNDAEVSNLLLKDLPEFWDRYDLQFFLFDEGGQPLTLNATNFNLTTAYFDQIITAHGEQSEIAPSLYYVSSFADMLSYISRDTVTSSNGKVYLFYILFRSKKIPEQIGIPRLLLNQASNALSRIERYAIARYAGNKLIYRFGDYEFPADIRQLEGFIAKTQDVYFFENGYSHFLDYNKDDDQYIVISIPEKTLLQNTASFSILVMCYGFLLFLVLTYQKYFVRKEKLVINLSNRIQFILIFSVGSTIVLFGFIYGNFVKQQYLDYNLKTLQEKLQSVEIEVMQKLEPEEHISSEKLGAYLNYLMTKFSNVFFTDINLYDASGKLIASSQPNLYLKNIKSELMNPVAFSKLSRGMRTQFIHHEEIGDLRYLSAYAPLKNRNQELLGYLNIQHFSKQRMYENQIENLFVSIINIVVLLLLGTLLLTVFLARWISKPLRMIQDSFANVDIQKSNEPIPYDRNDEIGALVRDYNAKVAELELKALELAKQERESAWREMAKQVAHEIKNPLTPMKLTIQHFQRSFDPSDENAAEKVAKLTKAIVTQIDTLTKITNDFSNFAKLSKPNFLPEDLKGILVDSIRVFESEQLKVELQLPEGQARILADKDLILRVINNLIKNAIQAIPEDVIPKITVKLFENKTFWQITISDNGVGIPKEMLSKIFLPNFTTKSSGAGLGLAMVKQIISDHNGEIWVESKEGYGATFHIRLSKGKEN